MRIRVRGWMAGAAVALLASACASNGVTHDIAGALRARGLDPAQIEVPFAVDEEMKTWAEKKSPPRAEPRDKLQELLNALLSREGMNLEYQSDYTVTAKEVFHTGRANCLSFTNIFVGLARELGVPAYFVEVKDLQGFNKEGDLIIVSGHVTAGYGDGGEQTLLDFTLGKAKEYRQVRRISDLTAIALFYSNRGAHLLRQGDNKEALGWLKTAVKLDPELPGSWVNYGVALRRVGDRAGAEASYRHALEVDPNTLAAYQNLAALLRLDGKESEALDLLAMVDRRDNRNPWSFLDLGDLNLRHGRLSVAERFYTKALHLSEDDPETYAAMGLLSLEQGNPSAARRWLKKAEHQKAPGGARTLELQQRLARGDGSKTPQPTPLRAAQPPGVGARSSK